MGAGAVCRLDNDGGLTILTGYVDMSGTDTTMATIAAETFGVDVDLVRIVATDSSAAPQSGVSGGSMVTYCLGSAVQEAAADAREQLLRIVSGQLDVDPADLEIADGEVRPRGVPDRGLGIAELATKLNGFGSTAPPVEGHAIVVPPELAPSAAAALVHVRVDPDTGKTEVLGFVAAQDVGRALNPALCDGQLRGGAVQSIGYALYEELVHDAGRPALERLLPQLRDPEVRVGAADRDDPRRGPVRARPARGAWDRRERHHPGCACDRERDHRRHRPASEAHADDARAPLALARRARLSTFAA